MSELHDLSDYLDAMGATAPQKPLRGGFAPIPPFEGLVAIPGQPGLFRSEGAPARLARDPSGFEIAESRPGRRAALRETQTTMTPLAGCGCNSRPGLAGLGSVESTLARARADHARYVTLKNDVQELLMRFPTLEEGTFREVARKIVAMPGDQLVRLTAAELALMLRAGVSAAATNVGLANAIMVGPFAAANEAKAVKLLQTAERVLATLEAILRAINTTEGYAGRVARATGLAEPVSVGVLIAGIIAGTIVAVIAAGLLYTLLASIYSATESYAAAYQACERAAAAGQPCTGEDWARYRAAALEEQRANGIVPNINDLMRRGSNAIITGGFILGGALLAYGLWVTAPAASSARSALQRRAGSY